MASDAALRVMESLNPCCALWKTRYSKMEEKRNALRQGVEILKSQIDRLQQENLNLKKAFDEERARVEVMEEEKGKDAPHRICMEKEIAALKSETSSMKPEGFFKSEEMDKEVTLLKACISERDVEIDRLKQLLTEEKRSADTERENVELENKKSADSQKSPEYEKMEKEISLLKQLLSKEKSKANEERKGVELEKKRAVELQKSLECEKSRADKASKIAACEKSRADEANKAAEAAGKTAEENRVKLETLKNVVDRTRTECEEVKKKLKAEKQKAILEKNRADEEKARGVEVKEIAEANEKKVMEEKCHANNLLMQLEKEKHKVEKLRKEMQEVMSSQRSVCPSGLDEVRRNLEAEKKKVAREKKRADDEKSKKEEHKKVAKASTKKAREEEFRADQLSRELETSRQRIENLEKELQEVNAMLEAERKNAAKEKKYADAENSRSEEQRRIAFENEKRAIEEKCRADNLFQELENGRQKLLILENELCELKSCRNLGGASSLPAAAGIVVNEHTAKLDLLKEQLKFEKKHSKHAKEVAKFEKGRNRIFQLELCRLRENFEGLLHHVNMLNDTFGVRNNIGDILKKSSLSNVQSAQLSQRMLDSGPSPMYTCGDADLRMSSLSFRDASCHLKPNMGFLQAENCISPSASFSDKQFTGSQGRVTSSPIKSAMLAIDHAPPQAALARCCGKGCKWNDGESVSIAAENSMRNTVEVAADRARKRRKILDEFGTIKSMHSEGKRIFEEAEEKLSALYSTLVQPVIQQMEQENLPLPVSKGNSCGNYHWSSKKKKASRQPEAILMQVDHSNVRLGMDKLEAHATPETRVNSRAVQDDKMDVVKCSQDNPISFERVVNGEYTKLLNLDDAGDEEYFSIAMERPLSPTLPEIGLCGSETGVEAQKSNMAFSASKDAEIRLNCSAHDNKQLYCVVLSDMEDVCNISKIFCSIRSCFAQCCPFLQTNWLVQDILAAIVSEKHLSPREKVCVLFSLILLNFSGVASTNSKDLQNQELLDSFSSHVRSVLSNKETRNLFAEICDFHELLSLIEDFMLHRKILLENKVTSKFLDVSGSSFEILHEGERNVICSHMAPKNLVVAGSIILASISRAVGQVASICEVSFNILNVHGTERSLMLTILHIFAHICGEEYFTLSNYRLVMKVVTSVVTFTEGSLANNATKDLQQGDVTTQPRFSPCTRCPFSEGSLSLDDISSMLLKLVQSYSSRHTVPQDQAILGDVVSSLELIVSKMGWDRACKKMIPELMKMLKACDWERNLSTSLVVLVGQLGRLGVESCGYDDAGVELLRCQLSDTLCRSAANSERDTLLTMAIVSTLAGLYPKGHDVFLKNSELPSTNGHFASSASNTMRNYLSSLSGEQVSSLFGLLDNPLVASS